MFVSNSMKAIPYAKAIKPVTILASCVVLYMCFQFVCLDLHNLLKTPAPSHPVCNSKLLTPPGRCILVDLGANCGNSYTLLSSGIDEAYLVEPQEAVYTRWLVPLASSSVHVFHAAVSDHNAEAEPFFIDLPYASDVCTINGYEHGASSLDRANAIVNNEQPVARTVRLLDISDFLRYVVRVTPDDFLLLKLDIEGGEEVVLRRLEEQNMLCLVDDLRVEWHPSTMSYKPQFEARLFHYEQWGF